MKVEYPFKWLSEAVQKKVFVILVFFTGSLMTILGILDKSLINETVPLGIVSFEFAGNLTSAQSMIESWGPEGQLYAALSLGLDYLFIILYASSIALGCSLVSRTITGHFISLAGKILALAQSAAAILDSVENYALIKILLGSENKLWPVISFWSAIPKFIIVGTGLAYIAAGAIKIVTEKYRKQRQ